MKSIFFILGFFMIVQNGFCQSLDTAMLKGNWQLLRYDAIEKIKQSPSYQNASPQAKEGMDRKITRFLDNTFYHFTDGDSLYYIDLSEGALVQRKAVYTLEDSVLTISESGKRQNKQAKILELQENKLVLTPLVNEEKGKMVFQRVE
ncbi:hypothetical protein DN752_14110 [Echinicola strongylocentroti]|uniref:Lipocalin-like domain-containing protein n=1 Tax=Echinicola strongylocentroti TaxID=1795355 RepID=A0A2Z4IKF2_9BACT|nr:lipocalin family protein [Echinicola strongylocentroti]AWW31170.1 hypothetical protein DN752_14110 [Echinicola strongylocentroti]